MQNQYWKGGGLPDVGDVIPIEEIEYDMMSYLSRTNRKLIITLKNGNKVKATVGKFFNDLIFHGKDLSENIKYSHYSIQKKYFDKLEIVPLTLP